MPDFSIDPKELEKLLNYCIGFAQQMTEKHGEFHPFAAAIDSIGQHIAIGGYTGNELPAGSDVYSLLQKSLRSQFQNKEIVAAAIAANVNIPAQFKSPYPDGIRVHLECSGFSRLFYLPYRISGGHMEYSEFITVDVPPNICSGAKHA